MNLPNTFEEKMKHLLGEEYEDYLKCYEEPRHYGLRVNTNKISVEDFLKIAPWPLRPVPWISNGFYYDGDQIQPAKHPYYFAGLYYLQEPSAMTPADRLLIEPGDRVLDVCAAPGGKATELGAKLQGKGVLMANDISNSRAKGLLKNIELFGIGNMLVLSEEPGKLTEYFPEYFDKILIDAPCSGEGMFRKNEVACEEWSPENVQLCADRQDGILECAARMLVPGGRLVYSTCTFAPAENEGSISRFLAKHEEFEIVPIDKKELGIPEGCDGIPGCVENPAPGIEGTLRLWPHKLRGEGHYAAVLQKRGELPEGCQPVSATGPEKGIPAKNLTKDWAEYFNFAKETFSEEQTIKAGLCTAGEGFLAFGDNLYRMPERMPGVKGLKVLRPGLHLGTLKKNRFEPAHALALSLCPKDVKHVWNLSVEEAAAYLKGQTFSAEGEKGWYLICVDGISLGWGKLAGGIMKNHYPKGLRKG